MYELLAFEPPFVAETPEEVTQLIINSPFKPIVGADPRLSKLVDSLLAKDPSERPTIA